MATSHPTTDWRKGFQLSIPVAMGYIPAGIAFGVLAQVSGLPIWSVLMLSVVLYAGAAQFACLPMLSAGMPIGSLSTNIAAINLRHIFYGLPLLSQLPQNKLAKWYCLFALTDETFSVLTSQPLHERQPILLPVSLFNQCWWVMASLLGALLGAKVANLIPHLDFALVCLFAILAYEQYKSIKRITPIFIAMIALIIASFLTTDWVLLLAISISMVIILLRGILSKPLPKSDTNSREKNVETNTQEPRHDK